MIEKHCIVTGNASNAPGSPSQLPDGILTISTNMKTLYFPDADLQNILSFEYSSISPSSSSDYSSVYRGAVDEVLDGRSATILVTGDDCRKHTVMAGSPLLNASAPVVVQNVPRHSGGIFSSACSYLFEVMGEADAQRGDYRSRAKVSWYGLCTTKREGITDFVANATSNSAELQQPHINPNLILRDAGNGMGVTCNGVSELEIKSEDDVKNFCSVVSEGTLDPTFCNVFTVTVEKVPLMKKTISSADLEYLDNEVDVTPVRLTFVTLQSTARNVSPVATKYKDSFVETLRCLARGALPEGNSSYLSSSRLLMLLSDMLLGKSFGAVVAIVDPNLDEHGSSLKTFALVEEIVSAVSSVSGDDYDVVTNCSAQHDECDDSDDVSYAYAAPAASSSFACLSESGTPTKMEELAANDGGPSIDINDIASPLPSSSSPRAFPAPFTPEEGDSGFVADVPHTLLKALETRQTENLELENKVGNLEQTVQELRYERDELKARVSGESGAALARKDRAKLRKALSELKEYDIYKGVMEQTFNRMKKDIEEISREREGYANKLEKLETRLRKEISTNAQQRKAIVRLERSAEMHLSEKISAVEERDKLRVAHAEMSKKMKLAGREIAKLREGNARKDDELQAAKRRISRVIVDRKLEKDEAILSSSKNSDVVSKAGNRGKAAAASDVADASKNFILATNQRQNVRESLSRAEGNLNAARKIMMLN